VAHWKTSTVGDRLQVSAAASRADSPRLRIVGAGKFGLAVSAGGALTAMPDGKHDRHISVHVLYFATGGRRLDAKIALEEHFVTPELKPTIFGSIGWDETEWETVTDALLETGEQRLAAMDEAGIAVSVLSLAAPCIQDLVEPRTAIASARSANDALAAIVAAHPERYLAFAALPLQDPVAAADELTRCVKELGFRGALANGYSSVGDLANAAYYDEPAYLPFWERVEELGVPFYLHPRNPLPTQRRIYEGREELLGPSWAFTVETATHAMRLMISGLFDRFPSLTIILGHMGELLPFAVARTEQRVSHIPGCRLTRLPMQLLRENFYLTTSGNFHTPSLVGAIEQVGVERVLFAVDYPFEKTEDAAAWFDSVSISEGDRQRIGRSNAQALLGWADADQASNREERESI
jgi:predicted TIM-barrel fold metal-dependent hydrolase